MYAHLCIYIQPIADRLAQHLEIICTNFQFSTRRTRILIGFIFCNLILIVNPMGRILVLWKSFRNNLEMLCHPICNRLHVYLDTLCPDRVCFEWIIQVSREWVVSRTNFSPLPPLHWQVLVSRMNESCLTEMNRISMNESCLTLNAGPPPPLLATSQRGGSGMYGTESCHTCQCHTYEWVMPHIWMSHISRGWTPPPFFGKKSEGW